MSALARRFHAMTLRVLLPLLIASALRAEDAESLFVRRVWPLFQEKCLACHGNDEKKIKADYDMRTLESATKGGESGSTALVPGKPEASRFFQVVTFPDEIPGAMPPSGHAISKKEVQILRDWIKSGAKLPAHNIKLKPQGPLPRSV